MGGWGEMRRGEKVMLVIGIVLVAGVAFLAYRRQSDQPPGTAFGAAVGVLVLAGLLAAAIRWAYVRWGGGEGPATRPPQFILTLGIVAFVLNATGASQDARESQDTLDRATAAVQEGAETCPDPLPPRLGPVALVQPSPALKQRLDAQVAQASPAPGMTGSVEFLFARKEGVNVAVLTLLPFAGLQEGTNESEVLEGASDAAVELGATTTGESFIAGTRAIDYRLPTGEFRTVTTLDCHMMFVDAADAETSGRIAELAVRRSS